MRTEETALELIGLAYEAALEPALWPEFLKKTTQATNARSGFLRLVDYESSHVGLFESVGYDPAFTAAYRDYYVRLDPYAAKWSRSPIGALITNDQALSWHERRKTEYHNDYEHPQGVKHAVGCVLAKNDRYDLQFALQRGPRAGSFGEDNEPLAALSAVMPHLARAVRIHRALLDAGARQALSLEALNHLRLGVILTDARGRPHFINRAAESLLALAQGLRITKEGLSLPRARDDEQLRRLIHAAAAVARGEDAAAPGGMRVPLPNGGALQLQVVPLIAGNTRWGSAFPSGSLAVFIARQGQLRLPWQKLAALYGLTRAEARLAAKLADGMSLEDAADALSVSINTARSHLKTVFQKTGVRRQAELVAQLLTGVLAHCTDDAQ